MGLPAATRPTKGIPLGVSAVKRIPRDAPGIISIAPFFARAFKCSSAALADLNPNSLAISARVGGSQFVGYSHVLNSRFALAVWLISLPASYVVETF